MKVEAGKIISIKETYQPIAGCTLSYQICNGISIFSLGKNTSISAESYRYQKLIYVIHGDVELIGDCRKTVKETEMIVTPVNELVGMKSYEDTIYLELNMEDSMVNEVCNAGSIMLLKDMIPYRDHSIVNMDLAQNDKMKYVLMSFDAGTGLSEHAAPAEAIVFGLEGEAVITYEGVEHVIHENEIFKFDRLGRHAVKAEKQFKMALLLVSE